MDEARDHLSWLAREFAAVVPDVDGAVAHERWQPGIGPFEEHNQLEFLHGRLDSVSPKIDREVSYPESGKRCDLVLTTEHMTLPIEAKLIRFRRDNGDIEPTAFNRVFSPFPGRSPSLLSDVNALWNSSFSKPAGLLGLYYESSTETFEAMDVEKIVEKVVIDTRYWYGIELDVIEIARFDGLRHPVFDRGAIITWCLP